MVTKNVEEFIDEVIKSCEHGVLETDGPCVKCLEMEAWAKGYDQGYKAGRNGEARRVLILIEKYLRGEL